MAGHSRAKAYFDKRVEKWVENKKEGEKKAKEEKHFSTGLKKLGMITKGNSYAKNGYFQVERMPARRKVYARAGAKKMNYDPGTDNFFRLSLPYPIQAHHILPKESFSESMGFTDEERKLLVRVPYDLNHGENIIFLPVHEEDCKVHKLPYHRGSHPTYNMQVYGDVQSIRPRLKTKEKPPCDKKEGPQMSILGDLKGYQTKWWRFLVRSYASLGTGSVQNHATQVAQDAAESAW